MVRYFYYDNEQTAIVIHIYIVELAGKCISKHAYCLLYKMCVVISAVNVHVSLYIKIYRHNFYSVHRVAKRHK